MSQELKYKISFSSDLSAARAAAGALHSLQGASVDSTSSLDQLAGRSAHTRQAFIGMEMAVRGDTTAIFGVAQAVKSLIQSFTAGAGAISVITLVLTAGAKAVQHFTNKYNEQAKASLDAANKTAEFSAALRDLMDKQKAVSFSLEQQKNWLEKIGSYFDYAAGAADKYSEALKKSQAAESTMKLAGVDVEAAGALLNAKSPFEAKAIEIQAERKRGNIKRDESASSMLFDQMAIERKMQSTREAMRDLGAQRGPSSEIKAAEEHLAALQDQRVAARQNQKEFLKLTTQIVDMENKIKDLKKQDKERLETIDEQLQVKNSQLLALQQDLDDNKKLRAALDLQAKADENRLKLQEKINNENQKELNLKAKTKTLSDAIGAKQKADAKALEDARAKEKDLSGRAAAAWGHTEAGPGAKTPEERIADAKKKAARGIRGAEISALTDPDVIRRIGEGEDIDTEIKRHGAVARAKDSRGRGKKKDDILAAADLTKAADVAKANREAMEKKQAEDISAMRSALEAIQKQNDKLLTFS